MSQHSLQMAPSAPTANTLAQQKSHTQAQFDKMWEQNPEQFNPLRNSMERERLARTWSLIEEFFHPLPPLALDLGCGAGVFSERMAQKGINVQAVDISNIALQHLKNKKLADITPIQDFLPFTSLQEKSYPLVVCTEVIAYLPANHYRLLLSELARLAQNHGYVICSTPVDVYSEDATQRFVGLAETEFKIHKVVFSHHRLTIMLKNFIEIPNRYTKALKDPEYRQKELGKRSGLSRKWFEWNSSPWLASLWKIPEWILSPVQTLVTQNHTLLLYLEKICRFVWADAGISHVIFIGTQRPILDKIPPSEQPIYRKQKRQVWE